MKFLVCCVFLLYLKEISGHGMMLEPPNRSSLWRFVPGIPANYDDNQNFCGGSWIHNGLNNGKCGVCGDIYTDPHPQANENTGKFGGGIVVREYEAGSMMKVEVLLTANHLGYFNFSLCELEDPNAPESGEECFKPLLLADGSSRYYVDAEEEIIRVLVQLPEKTCERCTLRWVYRAGQNWGVCDDGTQGVGCGPQESFLSCADIAIVPAGSKSRAGLY